MTDLSMQKSTDVRSRIEPYLNDRASEVLAACGLNLSDAIRLFLHRSSPSRASPFEVKASNAATIAAMREARSMNTSEVQVRTGIFNDLEKAGAAKARKPAKKQR